MLYRAGGAHEKAARRVAETSRAFVAASHFDAADRAIALLAGWNEADRLARGHLHDGILEHARGLRAYFALDYPLARAHLQEARETFEKLGTTGDLHNVIFDISSTYFYEDRFAESERHVASYVDQPMIDRLAHARGHHRRAELAAMRGDVVGAIRHQKRSLEINDGHDTFFSMLAGATLAELLLANGQIAEATAYVEHGAAIGEKMPDRWMQRYFEHTLAALDAARGYFTAARARSAPRLEELVARGDKWHSTSELAILLLCSSALDEGEELAKTARAFIDAYSAVPHDEAFTWWAVRNAVTRMRQKGELDLADEVAAVLDARMVRIARAFEEEPPPTTEDEAARSDAAKEASSR
jgi:hypothetical protein